MKGLIALAGPRKVGKTYTANLIVELASELGLEFTKLSFADSLRQKFAKYRGIAVDVLTSNFAKEEYRIEMIEYADSLRKIDPYIFIKETQNMMDFCKYVVIDDLRTSEELSIILGLDGLPFRVYADVATRKNRGYVANPRVDNDPTETDMVLDRSTYISFGGDWIYNNVDNGPRLREDLLKILRKSFITLPR